MIVNGVSKIALAAAVIPLSLTGVAAAQDAAPAAVQQARAEAPAGLDEVVVTARKRAENQQDTPISITAVGAEELSERRLENLRDLQVAVPSLQVTATQSGSSANAQLYIRGVGNSDYKVTSDQAVGLYLDGVFIARSMGASLDVVDVQQIEVLRGPQGTLFGRNSMAGAIQITTVQPSYEAGGSIEATVGSRDRQDLKLVANLPLADDRLAARLTLSRLRQEGYGKRLFQNVDTGDTNNDAARLQVLFEPSERLRFTMVADPGQRRGNSSVETLLGVLAPEFLAGYNADLVAQGLLPVTDANFVTGDRFTSWAGAPNGDNYDIRGLSVTGEYDLSDALSVKSITAVRTLETQSNYDFGAVPYPLSWQDIRIDQEQFSQELQLVFSGADNRLNGVIGAYYFTELGKERDISPYFELPRATGRCNLCFTTPAQFTNLYDLILKQRTNSKAIFAQASYAVTDRFSATAGVRYTADDKRLLNYLYYNNSYQDFQLERPFNIATNEWTDWAPHVSLEFKATPDALIYFTVSQGYKAGGYNGISFEPLTPEYFDPEEITSYEVGAKTEWLDRRLRLNANAFIYDYQNVVGFALINAAQVFENIGELYVYGGELEATALLGAHVEATLAGGYLAQDIRSVKAGGELTIRPDSRLPNFPKWTGDFSLKYQNRFEGVGELQAIASASYKGAHEFLLPNRPGEEEPGYTLINASASWTPNPDSARPITVSVFGRNLTDEAYKIYAENGVDFGFGLLYAQFGKPREWGLSLKAAF
jgi:iron complex outermembrane receptor protein